MRWWNVLLCVLLLWVGSVPVSGQDDLPELDVTRFQLDNGLDVLLVVDDSAPTAAVNVWYRVGSANDPEGRSGFAHMFEHIMFEGSANVPAGDFDRLLVEAGGENNAYTSKDVTAYYNLVPSHQLPLALWLEADRMASLAVTQVNTDNQRAVVIEEMNQNVINSPYGTGYETLFTVPFEYVPYQQATIGAADDLNAATVAEMRGFHDAYYAPNNATLVVAGDIDVETTRALIEDLFGAIPPQADIPELPAYEFDLDADAEAQTITDSLASLPLLLIGYEVPPPTHADYPALAVLDGILSTGDSSRMAQTFVDTGLAAYAYTYLAPYRASSLFVVDILPNEMSVDAIEQDFYTEVERIVTDGVSQTEIDKAVNLIQVGQISELEAVLGLSEQVQSAVYFFDDPQAVFNRLERLRAVTPEDVSRVAETYLAQERGHVFYIVPGESSVEPAVPVEAAVGDDSAPDYDFVLAQTTPPDPLPVGQLALPAFEEHTLANGLQVVIIQSELPLLTAEIVLPGGGSVVRAEQAGLASLTASLLTRGTESRSAQDIASAMEQVGGYIGAGAGVDALTVTAFAPSSEAALAFEILGDVVLNPTFPQAEVEVERTSTLTGLEYDLSDPTTLARRAFNAIVYGEHPYGNLVTETSLRGLTRDDIAAYYTGQQHPDRALLVVASDLPAEAVLAQAERVFGGWENDAPAPAPDFPPLPSIEGQQIYLIDVPGSAQAELVVGNAGLVGSAPDRYSVQMMNRILGGGFKSRLNDLLREEKGYTYGISSGFSYPVDVGTFAIRGSVGSEYVGPALEDLLGELARIRQEDVPADEFSRYRASLLGEFTFNLETSANLINQAVATRLLGLPLSVTADYVQNIEAVDAAAVLRAAQSYIDLDNLVIVVAGDAEVIEDDLEAVAPVTRIEPR